MPAPNPVRPDPARVCEELELTAAFTHAEEAYAAARERGRCNVEDPEALLADFLAERHFETLQAARALIAGLAAREAERRARQTAEEAEDAGDAAERAA